MGNTFQLRIRSTSRRDRKSTRLNSSHSQISYAVFCLKKKNNKATRTHLSQHLIAPLRGINLQRLYYVVGHISKVDLSQRPIHMVRAPWRHTSRNRLDV